MHTRGTRALQAALLSQGQLGACAELALPPSLPRCLQIAVCVALRSADVQPFGRRGPCGTGELMEQPFKPEL